VFSQLRFPQLLAMQGCEAAWSSLPLPLQESCGDNTRLASGRVDRAERLLPARKTCGPGGSFATRASENRAPQNAYQEVLARCMFQDKISSKDSPGMSYAPAASPEAPACFAQEKMLETMLARSPPDSSLLSRRQGKRLVPQCPFKVLDAPGLDDNFYSHPIDWSEKELVAVALSNEVYVYNPRCAKVHRIACWPPGINFTTVRWTGVGDQLAMGTSNGRVVLWDAHVDSGVVLPHHERCVGALAWHGDQLCIGDRSDIFHYDVRDGGGHFRRTRVHESRICGLDFSADGRLASGGNDNAVCIWEAAVLEKPLHMLTQHHEAAVKAIQWCPWQRDLLATGGGTADRKVCLWNASLGKLRASRECNSQVTAVLWAHSERELLTAHGYSTNQISFWRSPSLTLAAEIRGHVGRIMGLAQSPDGSHIVSASADETLRFWKVAPPRARHQVMSTFPLRTIR